MVGGRKRRSPDMAAVLQPYTAILSSSSRHIKSLCGAGVKSQTRALAYLKPHSPNRGLQAVRYLCENRDAKLACNLCRAWAQPTSPRIQRHTQPVGIKRASGSLSGWLLWGRRCIFKCSRRKPPPTQTSLIASRLPIQFTAWDGCAQRISAKLFTTARQLVVSRYLNGIPDKNSPFSR